MFNIVTVRSAFVGTYLRSSDLKIFKVWQLCNLNIFKFNIKRLCLIAKDLPLVIILLKSYSYLQILITNVLIILWRVWIHKRSSIPRFFFMAVRHIMEISVRWRIIYYNLIYFVRMWIWHQTFDPQISSSNTTGTFYYLNFVLEYMFLQIASLISLLWVIHLLEKQSI